MDVHLSAIPTCLTGVLQSPFGRAGRNLTDDEVTPAVELYNAVLADPGRYSAQGVVIFDTGDPDTAALEAAVQTLGPVFAVVLLHCKGWSPGARLPVSGVDGFVVARGRVYQS